MIATREDIVDLLQSCERGAEIGVHRGAYSERLLNCTNMTLYSIDIWPNEDNFIAAKTTLGRFGNRSIVMRRESCEASCEFEDKSLDFVYIDAEHDYESVKRDLHCWWPKVKVGGIMAGHDFQISGVAVAVVEFTVERHLAFELTTENYPSWIIRKTQSGCPSKTTPM